jgi:shikimate kinase
MTPSEPRSIFLIGPMGSGKTAVGKALAKLCQFEFIDSDHEIERRTGVDIPMIFEKEGEAGFRTRERDVIAELTQRPRVVLSTGGGAILAPESRTLLRERGFVVYLQTSVQQQALRVRESQHRPMLHGADDVAERLAALMAERAPLYEQTAHIVVSTDRRHVRSVAEQIMRELAGA